MGRVYTTKEVENRLLPKDGAQQLGMEEFFETMDGLQKSYGENVPQDYMGYGSVVEGRANIRSDIDVFVVYPDQIAPEALEMVLGLMSDIGERYNVSFEPNMLSTQQATLGHNHLDSLFTNYLIENSNKTSYKVGDPMQYIDVLGEEMFKSDLAKYFAAKTDKFTKAVPQSMCAFSAEIFQRTLELPNRIIQKFDQVGLEKKKLVKDIDFEMLQARDGQYNRILREIINDYNGSISGAHLKEYDSWMQYEYAAASIEAARLSMRAYGIALENADNTI